jgi:hypothetical protein
VEVAIPHQAIVEVAIPHQAEAVAVPLQAAVQAVQEIQIQEEDVSIYDWHCTPYSGILSLFSFCDHLPEFDCFMQEKFIRRECKTSLFIFLHLF